MRKQIAFSVSAGAYVYQMGVGCYLQRHYNLQDCFFSGASGGAWVALLLAAGKDIKVAFDIMVGVAHRLFDGRLLGSYLVYDQAIEESFHLIFQGQDVPSLVNGRLSIAITRLCWSSQELFKQEVIDHWTSNEDVLQCVIASALIPYALNGKPFVKYRGWHCLDGGVTNIEGINQAWALAHKRTASLIQANEGCLRSLEDMVDGLVEGDAAATAGTAVVAASYPASVMWHAVRWIPFADYVADLVVRTPAQKIKAAAGEDARETHSAKPPTHLVGFVGTVAKVTVSMVAEQVTSPVYATIRTVAGVQRTTWQLTNRVYKTTEDVAVQLHEVLPLKSVRDRLLGLVRLRNDAEVEPAGETAEVIVEADEEAATSQSLAAPTAAQSLHNKLCQSMEAMLTPWQLGRAASQSLTVKLKSVAQQVTDNIFGLLAMPDFSLHDSAELEEEDEEEARGRTEMFHQVLDLETAADGWVDVASPDAKADDSKQTPAKSPPGGSATTTRARPTLRYAVSDTAVFARGRKAVDDARSIAPTDGHAFDHTAFWGENDREFVIKSLPNGGKRLELAPWSWRKHDILTYHLSSDLSVNRKLFGLGILDAETHHWEVHEFFA